MTSSGRRIRNDKILHFQRSRVSIAALTSICGIIDGLATVLNSNVWYLRIIFACWGVFCMLVGLYTLWTLRNHPDFTIRKIMCAPCQLLKSSKKMHNKDNEEEEENVNDNNNGYGAVRSHSPRPRDDKYGDDGDEEQEDSAVI